MSDQSRSLSYNSPGRFYVDNTCIDCNFCRETAPSTFMGNFRTNVSYVANQPHSDEDISRCLEAIRGCPVSAIGDRNKV